MNKRITKFATISLLGIASATSIVLLNQNVLKINKDNSLTLVNQKSFYNLDLTNLIQLQNNQDKLLREISSKYDESNFYFKSWKLNNSNLQINIDVNFEENKNKINSWIKNLPNYGWKGKPDKLIKGENLDSILNKWIKGIKPKQINIDLNNFSNLNVKENIIASAGSVWQRYTFSQSIGSSGYPETKYFYENKTFSTTFKVDDNVQLIPINSQIPFLVSIKPSNEIISSFSGEISAKGKLKFNIENNNHYYNDLIYFKNQNVNWDKFFILKPSNIDNDGNYYYGTNRPSIEFGFNLPLVNAINWYSQIPLKFIELRNLIKNIEVTWSNNQYLFNEIFETKNNFFDFMNIYLQNFANFYYDEITYKNLVQFLKDLNKAEPSQEIRNVIKELRITKKDVQYKNMTIPANVKNIGMEQPQSGSNYNIKLLLDSLNLNPLNFVIGQGITNKNLWLPNEFKSIDAINQWNAYNDIILPIILSQKIQVAYEDAYNNQSVVEVYNGKEFVKGAIKPAAITGDFNSPYSTIKIKRIVIGDLDSQPYLGRNIDINEYGEFNSFVKQSKLNTTKTINGNIYASQNGFNDPIYMESTNDGIEIKFRYISSEKQVEEGAWSDIQGDNEISPFMLIPDEAWDDINNPETTPDSSLEDILISNESQELFNRTLARPFIMKKSITGQDLIEAKKKYINIPNMTTLTFTKDNIRDFFLNDKFTNKYNEKSNKPWWTWTFAELVQEETNYNNGVSGSSNVVQDNNKQDQWFKNFVSNPNLVNKTMNDFFPKYDEGRFFVIGSYKPAIDSTQVKLTEEAGFYYAGEQKDAYHQITNFNYVVELEVKNKTYFIDLDTFKFENLRNYNGKTISYYEYERMMNNLDDSLFKNKFKIQSSRFKEGQIQLPEFKYIPFISDNPLIKNGYGKLVIDYQKSIPVVNQIGNDVVYEQLPFDMMKLIGLESFYNNYKDEIISLEEYNQLSEIQKESKILIDTSNNQIIIGGRIFSKYQDFEIGFVDLTPAFNDQKPENTIYGFNQKDKSYISLEKFTNQWTSLSQEELINMFIKPEFKKFYDELVEPAQLKMYVKVENNQLIVGYTFVNSAGKFGDVILAKYDLTCINSVITNIKPNDDFKYGYLSNLDRNMSLNEFKKNITNKEFLVNYFNFENEVDKQNFINGIKEIKMLESNEKNFLIQIFLNENYVTYNENDSLQFRIYPNEIFKVSVGQGNLSIENFANNVKQALKNKVNSQTEILAYLNHLSLNEKLSLFGTNETIFFAWVVGEDENGILNPDGPELERPEIEDIIFSFEGNNLKAEVQLSRSNLALDSKTNLVINDFQHQLKVDLGLIDPHKKTKTIWLSIGLTTGIGLIVAITIWLIVRRQRNKRKYYGDNSEVSEVVSYNKQEDIDNNINSKQENNIDSKDIN